MGGRHLKNLLPRHLGHLLSNGYVLPKLVKNYFRLVVLKKPVLRKVEFALTYRCVAKCRHCSVQGMKRSTRQELDLSSIQRAVSQAVKLGAVDIHFTGGEALLHPEIEAILSTTRRLGVITSIASNGLTLSAQNVARIKRSGATFVSVSIDSASPEAHDAFRGQEGCFEAVIAGTDRCLQAGLTVFLCTVVTPENLASGELMNIVRIAQQRGIVLTLVLPCTVGRWSNDPSVLLNDDQLAQYHTLLDHPSTRWEGDSNYLKPGCPAGNEKIYITPYGDVLPCNFALVSFGNVLEEPVGAAWNRMRQFDCLTQHHADCKAGSDRNFIRDLIEPANRNGELPISYKDHPLGARLQPPRD